jgi:GR25 family glycosyltransferase involved in LPS biosynthesis
MKKIPSVVINLDNRPDRAEEFYKQFKNSDIQPVRISAIKGEDLHGVHHVPKNVAACWISHCEAFEYLLSTTSSHLIIFEDDAELTKKGLKFISGLNSERLSSIDLLQFGYLTHKGNLDFPKYDIEKFPINFPRAFGQSIEQKDVVFRSMIKLIRWVIRGPIIPAFLIKNYKKYCINEKILRNSLNLKYPLIYHSFEPGTHAYIISRKLAEFLIQCNSPTFLAADLYLMGFAKAGNSKSIRISKTLCKQTNSPSSIRERFSRIN